MAPRGSKARKQSSAATLLKPPKRPRRLGRFTTGSSGDDAGSNNNTDGSEWLDDDVSLLRSPSRAKWRTENGGEPFITLNVPVPTWHRLKMWSRLAISLLGRTGRSTAGYALVPLRQAGSALDTPWEPPPPPREVLEQRIARLRSFAHILAYTFLVLLIIINVTVAIMFLYTPVPYPDPKLMLNHSRLAVMIERRDQPHVLPILHTFLTHVEWDWPFLVYYGRDNRDRLNSSNLLKPFLDSGKLRLAPLENEDAIFDGPTLSHYLTRAPFWEGLPEQAETLLFFQADAVLCAKSQSSINDFLGFDIYEGGYDWMGAPWDWRHYPSEPYGGNGGFSIRRKSTMLNITRTFTDYQGQPEDVWFAERIAITTKRFPTIDRAMEFSFENPPYEIRGENRIYSPLGIHIGHGEAWPTCRDQDVPTTQKLLDWCPEVRTSLTYRRIGMFKN